MPRLFTLREANELVPQLVRHFERLQEIRHLARELREELADLELKARSNGRDHADEIRELRDRLEGCRRDASAIVAQIGDLGGEIKSVEDGLVDFRARREDRVVYLCWKLGEDRIAYWHELDTGFASRQPLDGGFA